MSVVATVGGREAVPLRALPYVTGWRWPPALLVQGLAGRWHIITEELRCYHRPWGAVARILPQEFEAIVDLFDQYLYAPGRPPRDPETDRDPEGVAILPPGCFVYRDEMEEEWRRQKGCLVYTYVAIRDQLATDANGEAGLRGDFVHGLIFHPRIWSRMDGRRRQFGSFPR